MIHFKWFLARAHPERTSSTYNVPCSEGPRLPIDWQSFHKDTHGCARQNPIGLVRDLNPGPLAPEARIIPLDQRAISGPIVRLDEENACNLEGTRSGTGSEPMILQCLQPLIVHVFGLVGIRTCDLLVLRQTRYYTDQLDKDDC